MALVSVVSKGGGDKQAGASGPSSMSQQTTAPSRWEKYRTLVIEDKPNRTPNVICAARGAIAIQARAACSENSIRVLRAMSVNASVAAASSGSLLPAGGKTNGEPRAAESRDQRCQRAPP